jgi:acyl carrier protein
MFPTMTDVLEQVKTIIAGHTGIKVETIKPDSEVDELGGDSLDTLSIIMDIEKTFGISISDDDIYGLRTVQNMVDYIEKHK